MVRYWHWLAAALLIGAAFLALGYQVGPWLMPRSALHFEPRLVEVPSEVPQGEPIGALFQLVNDSPGPLRIDEVTASCGCMALLGAQGRPPKFPVTLAPGKPLTLQLRVETTGRRGRHTFQLEAAGSTAEAAAPVSAQARLSAFIQYPLVAEPAELSWIDHDGQGELTATVELGDLMPNPGIEVQEVLVSHPDQVSAGLVPVPPGPPMATQTGAKLRYRLEVKVNPQGGPPGSLVRNTVAVVPRDARFSQLVIPIVWRAPSSPLELSPGSLTLVLQPGEEIWRRSVVLTVREPAVFVPTACETPQNIEAQIVHHRANQYLIECTVRPPQGENRRQEIVLAGREPGQRMTIPVQFIEP